MSEQTEATPTPEFGPAEATALNEALAQEMGIQPDVSSDVTPGAASWLNEFESESVPEPDPEPADPEPEPEKWTYTRDDGVVKEFDDEASYLKYKIGADANKWADKFRELEAKLEQRGEQPRQEQPQQSPEQLLFDKAVLENEDWKPVVNVMTEAFKKFYALQSQELQGRFEALDAQFGELKNSTAESAVRTEFGIDRATEQEVLEKQPAVVRDSLAKLDPAARLAVIRQLKASDGAVAKAPPPIPRAVPPQQAHVESSARNEPDRNREQELLDKFDTMSDKDQLSILGNLFAQANG